MVVGDLVFFAHDHSRCKQLFVITERFNIAVKDFMLQSNRLVITETGTLYTEPNSNFPKENPSNYIINRLGA